MGIIEESRVFLKSILSGVIFFICVSFFFFIFGIKDVVIYGKNYFVPLPSADSFAVQAFQIIERDLLPSGVHLFVTNPLAGFISEMQISFLMAFIILSPFFIYKIITYLTPALLAHERNLVLKSLLPSVALFFGGCLFAYFFVIPHMFKVLYPFAVNIGAIPLFSLGEFTSLVFSFMIITGIMFLLPIFMILLSFLGIVSPDFWTSKIRHVILCIMIFTAILIPDGTGITMLILSVPLSILYVLGCMLTQKFKKHKM